MLRLYTIVLQPYNRNSFVIDFFLFYKQFTAPFPHVGRSVSLRPAKIKAPALTPLQGYSLAFNSGVARRYAERGGATKHAYI
jgi:hypothetical protein